MMINEDHITTTLYWSPKSNLNNNLFYLCPSHPSISTTLNLLPTFQCIPPTHLSIPLSLFPICSLLPLSHPSLWIVVRVFFPKPTASFPFHYATVCLSNCHSALSVLLWANQLVHLTIDLSLPSSICPSISVRVYTSCLTYPSLLINFQSVCHFKTILNKHFLWGGGGVK